MGMPKVKMVGEDGNAFAILARCRKAARKAGWSKEAVENFTTHATSGDYDHLLVTVMEYFDVDSD